jgi:hypothetical protein
MPPRKKTKAPSLEPIAPEDFGAHAPADVVADMLERVNALADAGTIDGALAAKVSGYLATPHARNVVLAATSLGGYPWTPGAEGTRQNICYRLHDLSMEMDPRCRPPNYEAPRRRRRRGPDGELTEN